MDLIFGGAYQGKLEYVLDNYKLEKESVYSFSEDLGKNLLGIGEKKVLNGFHIYVLSLINAGKKPVDEIKSGIDIFQNKIIIADDISSGIVPTDEKMRFWREENGRCLSFLSSKADRVIRIFCGIGTVLK